MEAAMNLIPIQVTDEGIFIPKIYFRQASEVEVVITADYVLVRPKKPSAEPVAGTRPAPKRQRYAFIASGRTRNPQASVEEKSNDANHHH
jgi:hypothetical protein